MSDLAPLVAAALKDKTIMELQAELERKNTILKQFLRVKIIGCNEASVYAEGQFEKGQMKPPNLPDLSDGVWQVLFERSSACRLTNLRNVEFWLGERFHFQVEPEDRFEDKDTHIFLEFDGARRGCDGGKDVLIQNGAISIYAVIYGSKHSDWCNYLAGGPSRWVTDAAWALDYFDFISQDQDCSIEFQKVTFDYDYYDTWINKVLNNEFP